MLHRQLIFIYLFFLTSLSAEELFLRDRLKKAQVGDYLVTQQGKSYTLLYIQGKNERELSIEEVTIPVQRFKKLKLPWESWFSQEAPENTSWVIYKVNFSTGKFSQLYSYTRQAWMEHEETEQVFSTLLSLPFQLIPENKRKRRGPPLTNRITDLRKIWTPKMTVKGITIEDVPFDAWKAEWPKDGSEMAGKTIRIYLPQETKNYPSYFPYWLEISNTIGKVKIRTIDSGTALQSPMFLPLSQ